MQKPEFVPYDLDVEHFLVKYAQLKTLLKDVKYLVFHVSLYCERPACIERHCPSRFTERVFVGVL